MLIRLSHITKYQYEGRASYTIQRLKLTPTSNASQNVNSWNISMPGIENAACFRDGFGNLVHLINQSTPHDDLEIEVNGEIETKDTQGILRGVKELTPVNVFLRQTSYTTPSDEIIDLANQIHGQTGLDFLHKLSAITREKLDYKIGATHAHTTAAEALADGFGVCQDHAHVFISACRLRQVPARYVTGYLVTDNEADAHHAWAEAFVENLGWVGFDVANRICPTENYVRLACGLDAAHAAPVRGSRRGGGGENLAVHVAVEAAQ